MRSAWLDEHVPPQSGSSPPPPTPLPAGTQALSEAGLIPALLPMLRDTQPEHLPLVASTVRILEAFMDFRCVGLALWGGHAQCSTYPYILCAGAVCAPALPGHSMWRQAARIG